MPLYTIIESLFVCLSPVYYGGHKGEDHSVFISPHSPELETLEDPNEWINKAMLILKKTILC